MKNKIAIRIKQILARGYLKDYMYKGYVEVNKIEKPYTNLTRETY